MSARMSGGGAAGLLVRSSVLSQRCTGEEQEETPTLLAGRQQCVWLGCLAWLSSARWLLLAWEAPCPTTNSSDSMRSSTRSRSTSTPWPTARDPCYLSSLGPPLHLQ